MAYSNDENMEQYVPDILDHGVPAVIDGGTATTLASAVSVGASSIALADASGLQAGDFLKLDSKSNVEVVEIASISTNTVTLDPETPVRKNHRAGVKVTQADFYVKERRLIRMNLKYLYH